MFDFTRLRALVDDHQISEIIMLDTNVFMNNPRFREWKTAATSPVYVLSDRVLEEILRVERKVSDRGRADSARTASAAHDCLDRLLEMGDLQTGVHVEGVGWFITFDCPSREELRPEIDELAILVDTHGPNDAIFVLLTKHCAASFPKCHVILLTRDRGARTVAMWRGTPVFPCRQLPDPRFDKWLGNQRRKPIAQDWDQKLDKIIQETEEKSVLVSLTLNSKELMHNWPCTISDAQSEGLPIPEPVDVVMAKGYGTLHMNKGDVAFHWRVPFRPWTSAALSGDDLRGEPSPIDWSRTDDDGWVATMGMIDEYDFDFLGRRGLVSKPLFDGLIAKLAFCEVPSSILITGIPTLQSPICLTQVFLLEKVLLSSPGAAGQLSFADLRAQLSTWLSNQNDHEVAKYIDFVTSSWNIGHTIRTRVEADLSE